jgi:hypothetical protein
VFEANVAIGQFIDNGKSRPADEDEYQTLLDGFEAALLAWADALGVDIGS